MATLGDTFRAYIKPSADGILVIRKRRSVQHSINVRAIQDKMANTKNTENAPSKVAKKACIAANKAREIRVYVPGKGYKKDLVCPFKEMRSFLKKATQDVVGAGKTTS